MKVRVLLSTYNGEKFLREQLQSLADQSHNEFEVLIRDDGSQDSTRKIIENFVTKDSRFKKFSDVQGRNLGPIQSFALLLSSSLDWDILLFCDQDDIWVREKIAKTLAVMRSHRSEIPLAVHSDLRVCDENMRTLNPSLKRGTLALAPPSHHFPALLAQNFVTGCTLAINQSLAKISVPIPPEALMHDWWIALMAASQGELKFIPEALVLYRQHGENTSGPATRRGLLGGIQKLLSSRQEFKELMLQRVRQSLAVEKRLSQWPENSAYLLVRDFHQAIREDGKSAMTFAIRHKIRMDDLPRTAIYYSLLALENAEQKKLLQ